MTYCRNGTPGPPAVRIRLSMARLLSFGGLDGLNAAPLQWGLARGRLAERADLRLTLRNPADSARALASTLEELFPRRRRGRWSC